MEAGASIRSISKARSFSSTEPAPSGATRARRTNFPAFTSPKRAPLHWRSFAAIGTEGFSTRQAEMPRHCVSRAKSPGSAFSIPGRSPQMLKLERDGEIGDGASPEARNWYFEVEAGEIRLILCDTFGPRWRLEFDAAGRWRGYSLLDPAIEAELAADAGNAASQAVKRSRAGTKWPMSGSYSTRENTKEISG
jgi:hypothetical protein